MDPFARNRELENSSRGLQQESLKEEEEIDNRATHHNRGSCDRRLFLSLKQIDTTG
jgi:hypothetical protein